MFPINSTVAGGKIGISHVAARYSPGMGDLEVFRSSLGGVLTASHVERAKRGLEALSKQGNERILPLGRISDA
jgi:hypothetical protein